MEPSIPMRANTVSKDVSRDEISGSVSQSPITGRQSSPSSSRDSPILHPAGWSLQNEDYESWEDESSGASSFSRGPHDIDMSESYDDNDPKSGSEEVPDSIFQLQSCLDENCKEFLFACGGTVPIHCEGKTEQSSTDEKASSRSVSPSSQISGSSTIPSTSPHPAIILRWDPRDASTPAGQCRLTLPIHKGETDNIECLLADMEPATFGLGGKDVYDESYRKASKLDPSRFTTNFCPYAAGIIDIVSRILLPSSDSQTQRIVKAELYKMNMYTGPSGHFRPHVDTPRSRSQFGSLVVCLPVEHEGGALEVRHEDEVVRFEWASEAGQIQWAAFYSDCEHEVFPVQSGHRITLTYNLYATRFDPHLISNPGAFDGEHLPVYQQLQTLINDENVLPNGGYLGFYTTHTYPHNLARGGCLPDSLKGLDMFMWHTLQRLGCGVCLRPVLVTPAPFWGTKPRFHIGSEFDLKPVEALNESEEGWNEDTVRAWGLETIPFEEVVWLNQPSLKTKQAAFAYTVYGNESVSSLGYTVCSIIIGVAPFDKGERGKVTPTFAPRAEISWEALDPYDCDDQE